MTGSPETQTPRDNLDQPEGPDRSDVPQSLLDDLDNKTDQIFGLRSELATIYREVRNYLPRDEQGHKLYFPDIIESLERGEDLDTLLFREEKQTPVSTDRTPSSSLQSLPNGSSTPETLSIDKEVQREMIKNTFEIGIIAQRNLDALEGDFSNLDTKPLEKYYRYRYGEFLNNLEVIREREDKINIIENKIRLTRRKGTEGEIKPSLLSRMIHNYNNMKETLKDKIKEDTEKSPEAYLYVYGSRLRESKKSIDDQGRIIATPYVSSRIEVINLALDQNRPVFIHGELGSGKTELAKYVVRRRSLRSWEEKKPKPPDENSQAFENWKKERNFANNFEPLIINGHRGLDPDVFTASRTIKKAETPSPEEQVRNIKKQLEAGDFDDETSREILKEAYLERYKSPVEVNIELGPLLKGMKEGRPVIIDEINAIPHQTLVILNDLLLAQPGTMVTPPIPGSEPIIVKEGFGIIATGNYKPEDGVMYVGRQPMDAAFISRFKLLDYDFLPNNRSLEPSGLSPEESRRWRAENELMMMLTVHLANENLSLTAPKNFFSKIEKLSYVARTLQDVFSGKDVPVEWEAKSKTGASVPPREILKENVLSIRHLLPILIAWKSEGYSKSLDHYLFSEYISRSGARPEEKVYLYTTLKVMGDFFSSEGWPEITEREKILELDQLNLPGESPNSLDNKVKTFNFIEVIERVFGPKPQRELSPRVTEKLIEILKNDTSIGNITQQKELEKKKIAEEIGGLLERLGGNPTDEEDIK